MHINYERVYLYLYLIKYKYFSFMKISFNRAFLTRLFIAILFVVAGWEKLTHFNDFASTLPQVLPIPAALAMIVAALVILIEIPGSIAFALGWQVKCTGWALVGFVVLVTIFYHNPWMGETFNNAQLILALKNLAIVGGIIAAIDCFTGKCSR